VDIRPGGGGKGKKKRETSKTDGENKKQNVTFTSKVPA
jgi:hypothetical protein